FAAAQKACQGEFAANPNSERSPCVTAFQVSEIMARYDDIREHCANKTGEDPKHCVDYAYTYPRHWWKRGRLRYEYKETFKQLEERLLEQGLSEEEKERRQQEEQFTGNLVE